MRAQQHRADNTSRATAKLAELQARGLCAPPPEPLAAQTAIADRQSVDGVAVRSARAQVVGVVVPAYLSIEELLVKSGGSCAPSPQDISQSGRNIYPLSWLFTAACDRFGLATAAVK